MIKSQNEKIEESIKSQNNKISSRLNAQDKLIDERLTQQDNKIDEKVEIAVKNQYESINQKLSQHEENFISSEVFTGFDDIESY